MKIIGISGTNGSGKDTLADMLSEKYGFYPVSATEMLGAELLRRGLPTERENKRQLSAEWRRQSGRGVIVAKAVQQAEAAGAGKLVVGSLRNSGEVERVHELGGQVVWIDADPKIRYERIIKGERGRTEDRKSYAQFLKEEQIEMHSSGDDAALDMATVKPAADRVIYNEAGSVEEFIADMENKLHDLL